MRIASASLVLAVLLSFVAAPAADAWFGPSLKASTTKYDVRAAIKAKKITKKALRPASVELPQIARGGLLWGNPEAVTTIVMFTDIECPFCKRFHEKTFSMLKEEYIDPQLVRFVVKQFPLSFHPNAVPAAKAVICARKQSDEKARAFYEKLFSAKKLNLTTIESMAQVADLDQDALLECMKDDATQTALDADIAAGAAAKVFGTPSFLIIGPTGTQKKIPGAVLIETFRKAIDAVQTAK